MNAGDRVKFGLRVFHFEKQASMQLYDELPSSPVRSSIERRPDGDCGLESDCAFLCSSRLRGQCKAISRKYFGSEDVCDFRY